MLSCAPYTSSDEISHSVVKSEHIELVRGSDPPLACNAHTAAGDMWCAPTGLLVKPLAAGVWKTETKTLDRLTKGKK